MQLTHVSELWVASDNFYHALLYLWLLLIRDLHNNVKCDKGKIGSVFILSISLPNLCKRIFYPILFLLYIPFERHYHPWGNCKPCGTDVCYTLHSHVTYINDCNSPAFLLSLILTLWLQLLFNSRVSSLFPGFWV